MDNFTFYNPTRIVFGKETISQLSELVPQGKKILMTYGGGSIKRNGVYDQVMKALEGFEITEFGGIEANPQFSTLMKAVKIVKEEGIDFLLSIGGGSVLDGTKFIAAASKLADDVDAWGLLTGDVTPECTVPLASVLTLPATGSESNGGAVISRKETEEKRAFGTELNFPVFSILDPETTFSLPINQVRNGIIDTFVHVMEQYCTYPNAAPLQDRQAEAILKSTVETAQAALQTPPDYQARAAYMWNANQALNTLIGKGVPQDWATHGIGHELTAFYGVAHGESLAIVEPSLLRHQKESKHAKLLQYAERVWDLDTTDEEAAIEAAIQKTEEFFQSVGMPTTLAAYDINAEEVAERVFARFTEQGTKLGEHGSVDTKASAEILRMAA